MVTTNFQSIPSLMARLVFMLLFMYMQKCMYSYEIRVSKVCSTNFKIDNILVNISLLSNILLYPILDDYIVYESSSLAENVRRLLRMDYVDNYFDIYIYIYKYTYLHIFTYFFSLRKEKKS